MGERLWFALPAGCDQALEFLKPFEHDPDWPRSAGCSLVSLPDEQESAIGSEGVSQPLPQAPELSREECLYRLEVQLWIKLNFRDAFERRACDWKCII